MQEYFLVACSLADIIARFRLLGNDWPALPDKVAIQLNDTHPALAVVELMRILLDQAKLLGRGMAPDRSDPGLHEPHPVAGGAGTWPIALFEIGLPRHPAMIYGINRRFLDDVRSTHPGDEDRVRRVSLMQEGPEQRVRMANLAVLGSHSTNGVAEPLALRARAGDPPCSGADRLRGAEPGRARHLPPDLGCPSDARRLLHACCRPLCLREYPGAGRPALSTTRSLGSQAILNVGHSGKFSSDRTIGEYAADIWGAEPCAVDQP